MSILIALTPVFKLPNPNAATEAINDNELKGYVKRTLKVVGALL